MTTVHKERGSQPCFIQSHIFAAEE